MISFSLLVVAIIAAALAMFVWRARPYSTVNCWFAAFTISGAGWVLGVAALHAGRHLDAWSRLTFASASLIPAMFLCFALSYPTASRDHASKCRPAWRDRTSTRLNSSHITISYAVFCPK